MQLNSLLLPTWSRCLFGSSAAIVLENVGREADGGRRFVPVGCGMEQSGPPIDSGR
ncbi:unnamed protein product [Brassica rapa subsp. trilocularis]